MNSEHVVVLRQMWQQCANDRRMIEADALDAAIAVLSATAEAQPVGSVVWSAGIENTMIEVEWFGGVEPPVGTKLYAQPPADAQPVAYADPQAFINFKDRGHLGGPHGREWMWAKPDAGLVPVYALPTPSAPVGVERLAKRIETYHWDVADKPVAAKFADELRSLAQQPVGVDELAQVIRKVDGKHSLGAGALAEAILEKFPALAQQPSVAPVGVEGVRRYLASRDAKPMRGIDPEVIHAIHIGTEWEAELRMSDLRSLTKQPAAPMGIGIDWAGGHTHPHEKSRICHCVQCRPLERPCGCIGCRSLAQQPTDGGELAELVGLLDEVRSHFTRDDDLPDDLLPRIDAALRWIAGGES